MTTEVTQLDRRGWFKRFLDAVEWLGNLLPHPVSLFAILCLMVLLVSGLAGYFGLSVPDVRPGADAHARIEAVSLLNAEGLRLIVENLVTNFTGFVPLGTVLVALLGVGVADKSGLLSAVVRTLVLRAPKQLVTVAVVFAGVSGGYSANLLIGTVDPLLAGITEAAAHLIDPAYEVHAAVNWYFMIASTFLVTIVGSLVTIFVVEPRLGRYDPSMAQEGVLAETKLEPLDSLERRALMWAGIAALIVSLLLALTVVPEQGVLRNPETGDVLRSPFLRGIVALIFVFFLIPGVVYGKIVGTINNDRDLIDAMSDTMGSLGLYIVLVFFAAQFVAFFGWTNLGAIVAVTGAQTLQLIGLTGPLVFIPFIAMCSFINLMLGSASAQWAVTAPIFVPMLMLTGYSPEVIQAAYRIGDSTTNIITPMMSYFGLILAFATRFDRNLRIGTLIATMLPYSICLWIGWVALFFLWVFGLGLPVGPVTETYYPAP